MDFHSSEYSGLMQRDFSSLSHSLKKECKVPWMDEQDDDHDDKGRKKH